jgi:4-hydroxy-tetrahydrodipicolinate synthase
VAIDPARIRGSVPALVTPFAASGAVDEAAVGRLVEHVVAGGAHGFNVLGTTGEFALVPPAERRKALRAAAAANRGRLAMIVGCGRPSLAETRDEIAEAADLGADAALVTPSYYLFLGADEVRRWFAALAAAARIPLHFYNYPLLTKAAVGPALIAALRADGSIGGIKDSGGNAAFLARVLSLTAGDEVFRVLVGGSAFFLGALALGAHGVTGAIGGVAPWVELAVWDAFRAGDLPRARRVNDRLYPLQQAFYAPPFLDMHNRMKECLVLLGRQARAVVRPPLVKLDAAEIARLKAALGAAGIGGEGALAEAAE